MSVLVHLNQHLNGNLCPTLAKEPFGECAVVDHYKGEFYIAIIYVWREDLEAKTVVGWLQEVGATSIAVAHILEDADNGVRDGIDHTLGSKVRCWWVYFCPPAIGQIEEKAA